MRVSARKALGVVFYTFAIQLLVYGILASFYMFGGTIDDLSEQGFMLIGTAELVVLVPLIWVVAKVRPWELPQANQTNNT